jgi:hypothetical protein
MNKVLILSTLLSFSSMTFANTLKTTDLKGNVEPSKKTVHLAKKTLVKALKTKSIKSYKALLGKSRKLLEQKTITKTFQAAIVVQKNNKKVNLSDYEDYLETNDGLCYNGDIKIALEVAKKLNDIESIWYFDEYALDSIEINGNSIDFNIMDVFSYSDQDASEDDREDFITTYSATKC